MVNMDRFLRKCRASPFRSRAAAELTETRTRFRAWVRHYLDEWHYNPELGGVGDVESLLCDHTETPFCAEAAADPMIAETVAGILSADHSPVSIYSQCQARSGEPYHAIVNAQSPELATYIDRLERENAFDVAPALNERLDRLVGHVDRRISLGDLYYRARLGIVQRYARAGESWARQVRYQPFSGMDMTAPPPPFAPPGRANRQGIAVLYLASDVETAIAEIRPHPAHLISVAGFVANRDVLVADLGALDFEDWWHSDDTLALYHLALSLDSALSEAVIPEDRYRYTITQLVAELLRQRGYDGIIFRSAVGSGTNLCIFRPDDFDEEPSEAQVLRVRTLNYQFRKMPVVALPEAGDQPLDHDSRR